MPHQKEDNVESTPSYSKSGVDTKAAGESVGRFLSMFHSTFDLRKKIGRPMLPLGHFANILDLGGDQGLAIATDGVGTKLIVAQMLRKFDTIGIDCIAMNVNDIICIGAEPIAFVDYIACGKADPDLIAEVAVGLTEGAHQARVAIPGGEIAQVAEMLASHGDAPALDLVGTAVGVVPKSRILTGNSIQPGDAILGLASSGVHSNGFTLARNVLFNQGGLSATDTHPSLEKSVGEDLLTPTCIYVKEVMDLFEADISIRGMVHITGDGLLNLRRLDANVGYDIDSLLPIQPIFSLIQDMGKVEASEMFEVFNMGIGFVVIVAESDEQRALEIIHKHGTQAQRIGTVTNDPARTVRVRPAGLISGENGFESEN